MVAKRAEVKSNKNAIEALKLTTIKPISREDLPLGRGRYGFSLKNLTVIKEFNTLLDHIKNEDVSPFEVLGEIDTNSAEIQREKKARKSFAQSFRTLLKDCVKQHGLQDKIDVMEQGKGFRFFIIGREV